MDVYDVRKLNMSEGLVVVRVGENNIILGLFCMLVLLIQIKFIFSIFFIVMWCLVSSDNVWKN